MYCAKQVLAVRFVRSPGTLCGGVRKLMRSNSSFNSIVPRSRPPLETISGILTSGCCIGRQSTEAACADSTGNPDITASTVRIQSQRGGDAPRVLLGRAVRIFIAPPFEPLQCRMIAPCGRTGCAALRRRYRDHVDRAAFALFVGVILTIIVQ